MTAKARRDFIPEEYVLTGLSMNAPRSAYFMILSTLAAILSRVIPYSSLRMIMFSLPVRSGWNPMLSSRMLATLPLTSTSPSSGTRMPETSFRKVLFPAPFLPMMPTTSPLRISRLTSWKTLNSIFFLRNLFDSGPSIMNDFDIPRTRMTASSSIAAPPGACSCNARRSPTPPGTC